MIVFIDKNLYSACTPM